MSNQPAPRPLGTPSDPAADIKYVNDTIAKHLEKGLSKEDRATLELANKKLITHTATGFWVGTLVGAGWAFRSRWSAIARLRRAAASSPPPSGSFYPTRNPQQANETVKEVVEKLRADGRPAGGDNKVGSLVRAMGWGMLGAFAGSQVGLWSGRRAAQNVVSSSGHEERISKNLALAMKNAAMEVSAHSGKPVGSFKLPGMSQADWSVTEEDGDHVEEEERDEEKLAPNEGFYQGETVDDQSNERQAPPPDTSAPGSRWDQLRQAKPATASTWDTIRDSSARAGLPASARPTPTPPASREDLTSEEDDKERRRREFDELMEKERKGGDDFGSDSKWK